MRRTAAAVLAALILGALVACTSPGSQNVTAPGSAGPDPAATVTASPVRYPASWILPDRKLTPGAMQPGYTIRDICPSVNPALEAMRPSTAVKDAVYRAYGITRRAPGQYEIDHVEPIELLGLAAGGTAADPTLNLYPELNDTPDPGMLRKYHLSAAYVHNSKDVLEDVLHQKVCAGAVPLATAQQAIMTDWRAAYARYVGPPPGA